MFLKSQLICVLRKAILKVTHKIIKHENFSVFYEGCHTALYHPILILQGTSDEITEIR
jgi:hypothetical protein